MAPHRSCVVGGIPEAAFATARKDGKAVLAYIASESCPHCVIMAKETWCKPTLIRASRDVVMLAIHRHDLPPGSPPDRAAPDWVIRYNVMAYPQVRLLDGWGQEIKGGMSYRSVRTVDEVVGAIRFASRTGGSGLRSPKPRLSPESLRPAGSSQTKVLDPAAWERAKAWREILGRETLDNEGALALFAAEDDGVLRIEVLREATPHLGDDGGKRLLQAAMDADNDYVRSFALAKCTERVWSRGRSNKPARSRGLVRRRFGKP